MARSPMRDAIAETRDGHGIVTKNETAGIVNVEYSDIGNDLSPERLIREHEFNVDPTCLGTDKLVVYNCMY